MSARVRVTINGTVHDIDAAPTRPLLVVLREELGLTGAKYGCGEGECGACTVLVGTEARRACVEPVEGLDGAAVATIEGLAPDGLLHPVQEAWATTGALQCGYCTPGWIMATVALLTADAEPSDDTIDGALDGNLCRCGAYPRIRRAVHRAAELSRGAPAGPDEVGVEVPVDLGAGRVPAPPHRDVVPSAPWDGGGPAGIFAVFGDGIVAVVAPEEIAPPGSDAPFRVHGGAWVHLAPTGSVTAFSGKVNGGQNNRDALASIVAAELRIGPERVRLVLGDTDLSPYDMGTVGSRSMPDAGRLLRAAAAGLRELLEAATAERWTIAADSVMVVDGEARAGDRRLPIAELALGARRVETVPAGDPRPVPGDHAVTVATRAATLDAVRGAKVFPSDLVRPGMLHGLVLRPPALGATLRRVDTAAAEAIAGVVVVHDDDGFVGVAAPDLPTAARALAAVDADWDHAPSVDEDALVGHLRAHPVDDVPGPWGPYERTEGDVDGALASADVVLEATYTAAYIAHAPLEARVAVAEWSGPGPGPGLSLSGGGGERLTVWTGTQNPFGVRRQLADALALPSAAVRVVVPDFGGAFGGKHTGEFALEAARLARAARRPVKVRWSRQEEFQWAYARPAAVIDVRAGLVGDGVIAAWDLLNLNAGAAGIHSPYPATTWRERFQPCDSPLKQGSYRALAATVNAFARESHVDDIAHRLGVDPGDFRRRNLPDERLRAVLDAATEHAGWSDRRTAGGFGSGLALGIEKGGRLATIADVHVDGDGRLDVLRIVCAFDCGAVVDRDGLVNQIEGAVVMGLGGALFEALHFAGGRITNGSFAGYRLPRLADVPPIEVVLVDRPDRPSAGAGETPLIGIAPALANAVFAATGVRLRALPLAPAGVVPGVDVERH